MLRVLRSFTSLVTMTSRAVGVVGVHIDGMIDGQIALSNNHYCPELLDG